MIVPVKKGKGLVMDLILDNYIMLILKNGENYTYINWSMVVINKNPTVSVSESSVNLSDFMKVCLLCVFNTFSRQNQIGQSPLIVGCKALFIHIHFEKFFTQKQQIYR